jgi:hypothetical protein
VPGAKYDVRVNLVIASAAPAGAVGIGGAPGEGVSMKAGATTGEPTTWVDRGFVLLDAEAVHVDSDLIIKYVKELSPYQYEASLHDFYNFSIVSDCLPASILVYKHEFNEMFNDASQVVHYHQPNYKRQRQVEFEVITSRSAGDIHVLPLLVQIKPDVPVLFEHTGACNSALCSAEEWSWLLIHRHIVLSDNKGRYYVAKNIYVLFAYLMSKCDE